MKGNKLCNGVFYITIIMVALISGCVHESTSPNDNQGSESSKPTRPGNPTPVNESENVTINPRLSWDCTHPDGDELSYDISIGKSFPPPVVVRDYGLKNWNTPTLEYDQIYYWKIMVFDTDGDSVAGPTWYFTTAPEGYEGDDDDDDNGGGDNDRTPDWYSMRKLSLSTELPSYVNIMFQVLDDNGVGITDLETNDFEVFEDNVQVSPTESAMRIDRRNTIPYHLWTVLMLDNSLSVADDLDEIKDAAITLVNQIIPGQLFAVFTFSEEVRLLQGFTLNQTVLRNTINSIQPGFSSTNLYGAVKAGVDVWEDVYTTDEVSQGFMIILTDGNDTQGSETLENALEARGDKGIYAIGLGDEIQPSILQQIGTAGYYSINDVTELEAKFITIQREMDTYASSFYWLNYLSPKRGNNPHELILQIKDNINTGANAILRGVFNSRGFYGVRRAIYINVTEENHEGISRLTIQEEMSFDLHLDVYLVENNPSFSWTVQDTSIIDLSTSGNKHNATVTGKSPGETRIQISDNANDLSKTLPVTVIEKQ